MSGKKIQVTRSSMPAFEEYCEQIKPLWDSHWLTNRGVMHKQLECELHNYLGVDFVTMFVNGHSALECIFETLELKGEVITTPFTFASTTHAIARKGLKPVFCDIKFDDYTIDPNKIEDLITDKTCAIVPVHVYGNVCDVDSIQRIADKYHLKVIYDAAHAFGVKKDGTPVGRFGDASMFSFHATKVFNTIEGGAICHSDQGLCERLAQWRNFGITGPETVEYVGGNAKMNEFCAAMGLCNLRHIESEIEKRKALAEKYWETLEGVPGVRVCPPANGVLSNYAYLPVLIEPDAFGATRDDVFSALAQAGIGARKYFYPLVSDFNCYREEFASDNTPIAKYVAQNILTLPIYADLEADSVGNICSILSNCSKEADGKNER